MMAINNFYEFLLEKNKSKEESGNNSSEVSDNWSIKYKSQITDEDITLTKSDIEKLADKIPDVEGDFKWEKYYQFAKYFLGVKDNMVYKLKEDEGKQIEGGGENFFLDLLENIKAIKVEGSGKDGKKEERYISDILKGLKNSEIESFTSSMYEGILKYLNEIKSPKIIKLQAGEESEPGKLTYKDIILNVFPRIYRPSGKIVLGKIADDEEKKKEDKNKWNPEWNIPIDPERIKELMDQSELCIRSSLSCIQQISVLIQGEEKRKDSIEKVSDKIGEISEKQEEILKRSESFWKKYKDKEEGEKINLITTDKEGFNGKVNEEYLKLYEDAKDSLKKARELVDDSKITQDEWFDNIETYGSGGSVKVGEGLKKTMYETIKESFGYLQSAIDLYSLGGEGKSALSEYLKVYKEFLENSKSKYEISSSKGGGKELKSIASKK